MSVHRLDHSNCRSCSVAWTISCSVIYGFHLIHGTQYWNAKSLITWSLHTFSHLLLCLNVVIFSEERFEKGPLSAPLKWRKSRMKQTLTVQWVTEWESRLFIHSNIDCPTSRNCASHCKFTVWHICCRLLCTFWIHAGSSPSRFMLVLQLIHQFHLSTHLPVHLFFQCLQSCFQLAKVSGRHESNKPWLSSSVVGGGGGSCSSSTTSTTDGVILDMFQ